MEQNIVYQDMDDKDYDSLHVYCEEDGKVTAYMRAFKTEPGVVRMGYAQARLPRGLPHNQVF